MLPDFDSLALFVRVSELLSITRAAEASFMSLPAASRRISLLEERFGTRLLERTPKGVTLTPTGHALLIHAKSLLRGVNQLQYEMSARLDGRVRLLASTSAITHFLPRDIADFTLAHPDAQLSVGEAWSEEIAQEVRATTADLGIVVDGTEVGSLQTLPYRSYHIAVIAPQNHALATAAEVSYADVLAHDVIALESASLMMKSLFEQAVLLDKTLAPRVQVRSFEAVCRFVQAGLGVGLLPYEAAVGMAGDMELAIRLLPEPWAMRRMLLCFRADRMHNPLLQALLDSLSGAGRPHYKAGGGA